MWDRETGKPYTSIEATADFNDLCLYKQSGLLFLANEQPKMQVLNNGRCLFFLSDVLDLAG
jgi:ribosome biogenesis protein ENP2